MICRACTRAAAARTTALRAEASLLRPQRAALRTQPLSSIASTRQSLLPSLPAAARAVPRAKQRSFSSAASAESAAPQLVKPAELTEGESQVWDTLVRELEPTQLVVQDVSGGCGSMYAVDVSSERFRGLNMLKQQRLVNSALGDLVKQWHGVQIRTSVP
ncbi:bola protein [Podospora aff. communis PSN243]|uniref:Bola protein n=1 Tax=Podospora aff. communis PSN243 TaxID=3040156 RepID=A0AAV9G924_9PEZI|nr:bola protein [Podospora aff. communis PSN243]